MVVVDVHGVLDELDDEVVAVCVMNAQMLRCRPVGQRLRFTSGMARPSGHSIPTGASRPNRRQGGLHVLHR